MPDPNLDQQVRRFFDAFTEASDELDVQALGELFAAAGISRVVLEELRHEALDDAYVLARTQWRAERAGTGGPPAPLRLASSFLLRRDGDRLRVVLYLNHQDLGKALSSG
jgi:hypothetical protein